MAAEGGRWAALCVLVVYIVLAILFARNQFRKTLLFDPQAASKSGEESRFGAASTAWAEALLPDPLAALVSRQLRSLIRAPRFRLLFMMGFSFGLLIWLPLAMQAGSHSPIRTNYLTMVTAYSIMLLGDILFWNVFGPDRAAAQLWFVLPIRPETVLISRNIAAGAFVLLETVLVSLACLLLRMPVTVNEALEALGVAAVLSSYMLSIGNVLSVWHPRPIDPSQSWRTSSSTTQAWLFLLYPVVGTPVLLAYGARYAFDSPFAFWIVLAIDLILAGCLYSVTLEYAAQLLLRRRELVLDALARGDSPVAG